MPLDPGFDTEHTVVAQVGFVQDRYSPEARDAMVATALERVRAIPGVVAAAATTGVPLTIQAGRTTGTGMMIEGITRPVHVELSGTDVGPITSRRWACAPSVAGSSAEPMTELPRASRS